MRLLPTPGFRQVSWPVSFGGRQLGVLEKTAPYLDCYFSPGSGICRRSRSGVANEAGGAQIELGFRVTDAEAVRRAGFVDAAGEDNFRWIQIVDFITVPDFPTGTFIRRATRVIDPTALVGAQPDPHPYYWDWERNTATPHGFDDGFHIRHFLDRQARNGLCYDLIFTDQPRFRLTAARPGRRAYFAFEVALVGVRLGNRNVILISVRWGFDLVVRWACLKYGWLRFALVGVAVRRTCVSRWLAPFATGSFRATALLAAGLDAPPLVENRGSNLVKSAAIYARTKRSRFLDDSSASFVSLLSVPSHNMPTTSAAPRTG